MKVPVWMGDQVAVGAAVQALDRGCTVLWLAYPAMLFSLPNEVRVGGFPPETLVAAFYLLVVLLSVVVASTPVKLSDLPDQVPLSVLLFFSGVLVATGLKGDAALLFRVASWGGVLLIASVLFRDSSLRRALWKVWFVIGVGTSIYSTMLHGLSWPEQVDILAWTHRTVLGYFLAMSVLLGIHLSGQSASVRRALYLCGAAVCGVALVASLARGAWIFVIVGMIVYMRARKNEPRIKPILIVLLVAVVAAISFGASGVAERATSIVDLSQASSSLYRANIYFAAVRSLSETWLMGAPTLDFGPYLARFSLLRYPHLFNVEFATDSDVIHLLLLGGLPLISVLCVVLTKLGTHLWRSLKVTVDFDPRLWLFLLLAAQLVLDNVFSSALGWFYLGVICTTVPVRTYALQQAHKAGAES